MTGPAGGDLPPGCEAFDFDGGPARDGTVDLADFTAFGRVFATRKVPLGGYITSTADPGHFRVYMPTKWGGVLTVFAYPNGNISAMRYPDGSPFTNGTETGENKQGWYTFVATGSTNYEVHAVLLQTGQAATRPWNFYWWSKKSSYIREKRQNGNGVADTTALSTDEQAIPSGQPADPGADIVRCGNDGHLETSPAGDDERKTLYALFERTDPYRPLDKYDQLHGGYPRSWEAQYDRGEFDWWGHCLGAAMASILKNEPTPASGTPYNQEEVEGLWTELGENDAPDAWEFVPGHTIGGIPPGPPVAGYDDTDGWVATLHARFEECVRNEHVALQSNLRAAPDPNYPDWPLHPDAVWNHAIYQFSAAYAEAPGGDERVVHIVNALMANDDHMPPTDDEESHYRAFQYTYIVRYLGTGAVDEGWLGADFIAVAGEAHFALENLIHVTGGVWDGENPWVDVAGVLADDGAN